MSYQRAAKRSGRVVRRLVPLFAVIAIAGVAVFFVLRRQPQNVPDVTTAGLTVEELTSAVSEAQIAIGHLENEKFLEADQILSRLVQTLPHEPLVVRDLAICRVLILEGGKSEISVEGIQKALDALVKVEPESAVTNWLAARAYLKLYEKNIANESAKSHYETALQKLRIATQQESDNAAFWYQTYEACNTSNDPAIKSEGVKALDEAYRIAPTNLRVTIEWLVTHAAAKDPELAKSVGSIRALVEPLAAGVKRRTNVNVLDFLDQLKDAVERNQWGAVPGTAMKIRNILVSEEVSHSDQRLVLRNPLEFVLYDFSETVRNVLSTSSSPTAAPAIEVSFASGWSMAVPEVIDAELADFNLDGRPELAVLKAKSIEVFQLQPDGQIGESFISASIPEGMQQMRIADLDRDTVATAGSVKAAENNVDRQPAFYEADPDLVIFGTGGIRVLKNHLADDGKTRTLELMPQDAEFEALKNIIAGTLVDIDHEGDLDVILSVDGRIQVWWNRGNLTFEDASAWSQMPPAEMRVETMSIADWDRDVDIDVIVGGGGMQQSGWLENLRHGQVRWRAFDQEFDEAGTATNLAVLESDGNVSWDLLAVGKKGAKSILTSTLPAQAVTKLRSSSIAELSAGQVTVFDYDNDGSADAIISGEGDAKLFRGQPDGSFAPVTGVLPESAKFVVTDATDADLDGDLDLLVITDGNLSWLRNNGGNKNHWLSVRVRGEAAGSSGRVNHFGLGSMLELKSGQKYQSQVVQRQTTHFGLGSATRSDVLRVLFTNGIPQSVIEPKPDQLVSEIMINKTSCPFVYAWTGSRFEFVTDLLWNAPLGLQLADGVIAKDRPWEYLKIRGDQLVPRNGYYELQVTSELWEADYFDQIELIAVDHPKEIEVYSNEKVGPAEIAELKVHTVRNRRELAGARNHRGRDLMAELTRVDGDMAVAFDQTFSKGRAEDHYLEIDFGKLESPRRVMLFLTGWLQPGDTSLNVAASHNPKFSPGQPPSIWSPDADGEWKPTMPFMGFPGGKPKTIAVDVSNAFQTNDYRLRIATNFELYWDEIFFTVDEEPFDTKRTILPLVSADLHYRGFSAVTPFRGPQPETYTYDRCDPSPHWPPMRGTFTRFGDVKDLLTATDRQLAVLASGDEMTLRFAVSSTPPDGWERDFLLHSVGWDKDADLNTVVGQTVEPLPFVGMPGYPYDTSFEEWDAGGTLAQYLRQYQTRQSSAPQFWQELGGKDRDQNQ